ncbi:MAG: L-2-hydroxyglutarate oxidase [Solirubrobacterales bacterium]
MWEPASESSSAAPSRCDIAVVGGGIVGLAVARELSRRHPAQSVCVLEKEAEVGAHQTSHNSGVVHAGIYYAPGSLKAALCVRGAARLYEYCEARRIPFERCGKLIVACEESEVGSLEELGRRGAANGVAGLRRLDAAGIRALEPHARGVAGLHSPGTGIVDFRAVAHAYAADLLEAGGSIATGCEVERLSAGSRSLTIHHDEGVTEARNAVCCAGAWSDRLAVRAGADPDPRIVPFRGAYLQLVPERRDLVRALIYPVPDPSLPFLGVHLSRRIDGEVLIGPTALLAGARDAYSLRRIRAGVGRRTLCWPGSWRMFRRWWRTGLTEIRHAASRRAFVTATSRYLPEIGPGDVEPSFAGVRAQAVARDGGLVDDFAFSITERALHVRNAPSPGATSSLAIAAMIADEAERVF